MRFKGSLLALVACSALASGCQIYFGGDDDGDDTPCDDGWRDGNDLAFPEQLLRNPYTGECVTGGGGPGPCGDERPASGGAEAIWFDPRWPVCESYCNSLGEDACVAADGCRAIYVDACPPGVQCFAGGVMFATCWATAQDGPVRGGDCTAITDAFECSQHDDCAAVHESEIACGPNDGCDTWPPTSFRSCTTEPTVVNPGVCSSDLECPADQHCDLVNYCEPHPDCMPDQGCPPVCYGKCVPDVDPPPPPPPPPACEGLDEAVCIDMVDGCLDWNGQMSCGDHKCEPIYSGSGCSCDASGCTCQEWTYETCRKAG